MAVNCSTPEVDMTDQSHCQSLHECQRQNKPKLLKAGDKAHLLQSQPQRGMYYPPQTIVALHRP